MEAELLTEALHDLLQTVQPVFEIQVDLRIL